MKTIALTVAALALSAITAQAADITVKIHYSTIEQDSISHKHQITVFGPAQDVLCTAMQLAQEKGGTIQVPAGEYAPCTTPAVTTTYPTWSGTTLTPTPNLIPNDNRTSPLIWEGA